PMLTAIVLISNMAVTFNSMSVESLMAHATPDGEKGRAAGWFQAGNLGGYGLGGGVGLWLAERVAVGWVPGAILGGSGLLGCIVSGSICDRMDRRHAYALFGALMAASAVAMGLCPRTQFTYVGFVLLYAFITGFAYAGFSAVVLEAIGGGAAATKYSVFASLS